MYSLLAGQEGTLVKSWNETQRRVRSRKNTDFGEDYITLDKESVVLSKPMSTVLASASTCLGNFS